MGPSSPPSATTFAQLAVRLDAMGGQLAAFRALRGTKILALDATTRSANGRVIHETPPTELRDALVPLHRELCDMVGVIRTDPATLGRLVPTITAHLTAIEVLVAERYPAETDPTEPAALVLLEKRLMAPIIPHAASDGRV